MLDNPLLKTRIRTFITINLIHDISYPLADDEALITGDLIDMASLADLAVFIEETFGVTIDEDELTNENIDTLNDITRLIQSRLA